MCYHCKTVLQHSYIVTFMSYCVRVLAAPTGTSEGILDYSVRITVHLDCSRAWVLVRFYLSPLGILSSHTLQFLEAMFHSWHIISAVDWVKDEVNQPLSGESNEFSSHNMKFMRGDFNLCMDGTIRGLGLLVRSHLTIHQMATNFCSFNYVPCINRKSATSLFVRWSCGVTVELEFSAPIWNSVKLLVLLIS